jgi:hypothetical protein
MHREETMKSISLVGGILLVILLFALPLSAQRAVPSGGGDSGGGGRGVSGGAVSSSTSVSVSSSSPSYSGGGMGNRAFGESSGSVYVPVPNLSGTSFYTPTLYTSWMSYYGYLSQYYRFNPLYFNRFYVNREPLITPAMLKITLRQPLILSAEILSSIDELEALLLDAREGKTVDKTLLAAKAQEIRDLARRIRQDRTISLVDLRKDAILYREEGLDVLSPEAVAKLREMALDLNRQLENMYNMSSSSTISVETYKAPSFGSEAKSIEKLCKAIENSSKRL